MTMKKEVIMTSTMMKTKGKLGLLAPKRTEILNDEIRSVKPRIDVERAGIITESYEKTVGLPQVLRRAYALKDLLMKKTIFIGDNELIVGNHGSTLRSAPIYPEFGSLSREELEKMPIRQVDTLQITPDQIDYLVDDIFPKWEGYSTSSLARNLLPSQITDILDSPYRPFDPLSRASSGYGHYQPNIKRIINEGFEGSERLAAKKLAELDPTDLEYSDKRAFYMAVQVVVDGVRVFQQRFSDLAAGMANETDDPQRAKELRLIASNCAQVPYRPARNFFEAAQSYWFTLLIDYCAQNGGAISGGRFDQYMYPFYVNDLKDGTFTKDEISTIIQALWVKHMDLIKAKSYSSARNNGGFATTIGITLGGVDKDGNDAVNDLSYLCLDAEEAVFNSEPNVGIRVSKKTPDEFVNRVLRILGHKEGGKDPFFNDERIIPALMREHGMSLEEARDWSLVGCVEPTGQGNTMARTNSCYFNLAKCLELAINDGKCPISGQQLGPHTGHFADMNTFDDVKKAYSEQVDYFVSLMVCSLNTMATLHKRQTPHIYSSILIDGCLESGHDCTDCGALYDATGVNGVGLSDVADSLLVMKQLVFDESKMSKDELAESLETDFSDKVIQQRCLNVPKYGNDNDEADEMVAFVAKQYSDSVRRFKSPGGGHYIPGLFCLSSNTPLGRQVGALPSGRKALTPLADGGISPKQGEDVEGPTAEMKSVASWDQTQALNGVCLNIKFVPALIRNATDRQKVVGLIRGYFDIGGVHIQLNVLSSETLINAQKHPENYRGLVVRVAGYSAFFVELDRDIQNEIISRTVNESI